MIGQCPLCDEIGTLARSHCIPYAFFRLIDYGTTYPLVIPASAQHAEARHRKHGTGAAHLLCVRCEKLLADRVDGRSITYFKGVRKFRSGHRKKHPKLDPEILTQFAISVLWRASLSRARMYSQFKLSVSTENLIKEILLRNSGAVENFSLMISRLTDNATEDGFSANELAKIIVPPYQQNTKSRTRFKMVMCGFLMEIHTPGLPRSIIERYPFVRSKRSQIPDCEVTETKETFQRLLNARALREAEISPAM